MQAIFSIFWRITSLQDGPETVPANNTLLALIAVGNVFVSLCVSLAFGEQGFAKVATTIVINLAALAVILAGLLAMMGKYARLNQTLTAYLGCDLLLNVFYRNCYWRFQTSRRRFDQLHSAHCASLEYCSVRSNF